MELFNNFKLRWDKIQNTSRVEIHFNSISKDSYINGIIEEKPDDYFWNKSLSDCESFALVDRKDFEKIFEEFPKDVYYDLYEDFDYRYLNTENTDVVRSVLKQIEKKDEVFIQNITPVIKEAKEGIRSVQQMLYE